MPRGRRGRLRPSASTSALTSHGSTFFRAIASQVTATLKTFALLLAVVTATLLPPAPAQAVKAGSTIDIQLFHPTPDIHGFFSVESDEILEHLSVSGAIHLNWAHRPLRVRFLNPGGDRTEVGIIVRNREQLTGVVAIGLYDIVQIGAAVPLVWQHGFDKQKFIDADLLHRIEAPRELSHLGDLRLMPRVRLFSLKDRLLSGTFSLNMTIPTAGSPPFAGEEAIVFEPVFALTSLHRGVHVGMNLGYRYRPLKSNLLSTTVGDEILFRAATSYGVYQDDYFEAEVIGEIYGQTGAEHPFRSGKTGLQAEFEGSNTALEGLVGVKLHTGGRFTFSIGGAGGMIPGWGAAAPRIVMGMQFYPGSLCECDDKSGEDADGDGLIPPVDQCPLQPEDLDRFLDNDGCPDPDNDKDGIPDIEDKCPNTEGVAKPNTEQHGCPAGDRDGDGLPDGKDQCPSKAEDIDGFEDEDGCPDTDNDKDTIPDAIDACPDDAEDVDQFKDDDGCPEPDNDGDGVLDADDACPVYPEDADGVQDDDGCPEDNDLDGFPDWEDACPNEAETFNNVTDDDGCPEDSPPAYVEVVGDKVVLKASIIFETGSARISPKSSTVLAQLGALLKRFSNVKRLRIEGHTDSQGSRRMNVQLSQRRAESVVRYLVKLGLERKRFVALGVGPDQPLASNATPEGRRANRRVEIVIVEQVPFVRETAGSGKRSTPVRRTPQKSPPPKAPSKSPPADNPKSDAKAPKAEGEKPATKSFLDAEVQSVKITQPLGEAPSASEAGAQPTKP